MINTKRLTIILLAGAILSVLAISAVYMQRQILLRGTLNGLPDVDEAPERIPILGVNADLAMYDAVALEENLDLIAETGFVWVRQPFRWNTIELAPGEYEWERYDALVEGASERGLRIVAVLLDTPEWASEFPNRPPNDLGDFTNFAAAVATRYGDRIDVYQIWDEPNIALGWGFNAPDALAYAVMLEAAYTAIHGADDDAFVLTAGLAATTETGPENISDLLYLESLYGAGASDYFDGVASKPYGFDTGPDDRRVDANLLNFSRIILLREAMVAHGDADKPLWSSHFGWNVLPAGWGGDPSIWGQATPEQQAEWVVAVYDRALAEWPWCGAMMLESWQPNVDSDDARWGFAMRSQDGELQPAVEAIREAAVAYNTSLYPGAYSATHPLIRYTGEWEFSGLGADIGQADDSAFEFDFVGDSAGVIIRRGNYRGYLYVTVDGEPPRALPTSERGAYLILTSPEYDLFTETLLFVEGVDPDAVHHVRIEADYAWDRWAIAGFAVGRQNVPPGYVFAPLALGAVAILYFIGAVWAASRTEWPMMRMILNQTASRISNAVHVILTAIATAAFWVGATLTWGGALPNVSRQLGDGPSLMLTALTAGVFYFSPWLFLTLVALAVLFILIYLRLDIGLALVIAVVPFYTIPRPLFDRAFSMLEIASLLCLAAWLLRTLADRREKGWPTLGEIGQQMTGLDRAVAVFVGLGVVSLVWAEYRAYAVTELRQMVLEPAIVYLILRTTPFERRSQWRLVDMMVLAATVAAGIGLYRYFMGIGLNIAEGGTPRLDGIFMTPNVAALHLGRVIPVAAAVMLMAKGKPHRRWLYGAGGVIMLVAAILTLSKGGLLLGIPAGLAVVVIVWLGRNGLFLVLGGLTLEALAIIPLSRHPRFSTLFDLSSGSSFFRIQLWQSALRMIREHPILGLGLDQFLYEYRSRYILPEAWQQPDLNQPHNVLLNYWVRLGILGLIAGLWIQVAFWRLAHRTQKRLRTVEPALFAVVVGFMGSMADFLAHGMVDGVHFVIDLAFIFYLSLGLVHQLSETEL